MESNMKKPGEIAKLLKVSGMSVRNYVKHFKPFLSETATANTGRKFTPEDVDTLQHAKKLLDEGKTYSQVCEVLKNRPLTGEVIDDIPPEPETETEKPQDNQQQTTSIQLLELTEMYNNVLKQLGLEHQETINAKDETINAKDEIIARQDTQIEDLEKQVERERQQKRQYYENLPRLVKWFTKPPE